MAAHLTGRPTALIRARRLRGGIVCSTHLVELGGLGRVVLKRSPVPGDDGLAAEFARLGVARAVAVPTPEPLALDADGAWFGGSALVMSALPGRSHLHGGRPGAWLAELAEALAVVHDTHLPAHDGSVLHEAHGWQSWQPPAPAELPRSPRVDAVLVAAGELQRDLHVAPPQRVLVHHDYHPGNVCWHRGRLAGVTDWAEARLGPAVADVAYCSVDLAITHGVRAVDEFVARYAAASGASLDDLVRWQLLWIVNAMRWARRWLRGYVDLGLDGLSPETVRRRIIRFADRTLARA